MSRLKTACSTAENLIRATERALGSVNPSKKSTPFYLFTVSSLYREPWLSRDLLLKEAGEETMLFGLLSSGPLFSQDGFYEKGLILGRIDSPELHLESVILEGNGQKPSPTRASALATPSSRASPSVAGTTPSKGLAASSTPPPWEPTRESSTTAPP